MVIIEPINDNDASTVHESALSSTLFSRVCFVYFSVALVRGSARANEAVTTALF